METEQDKTEQGETEQSPQKMTGKPPKKKKKRISVSTILLVLILLTGVGVLAYPTVSDWWNSMHASRAIAGYVDTVEDLSAEEREEMLAAAKAYNDSLTPGVHLNLTDQELSAYNKLLDITGTGIMGYVQIPVIDVLLPVYHTTDESVLQIAIGHIPGSSLPVGGYTCHTVLSGHRGLPSARLLTDLDRLAVGDIFTITTLDQTITYMVDQIRIVLPEETQDLAIERGKDFCTLVTCTPYGVNSHRMLVRGTRIENLLEEVPVNAEAVRVSNYVVIPAVGVPLLFVVLTVLLIHYRKKPPKKSHREMLDDFKRH